MPETLSNDIIMERIPALIVQYHAEYNIRTIRDRLRVLVVEDQDFSCCILQEFLRKEFDVDIAHSARSGMRLYLEKAPDIIFLDIALIEESGHKLAHFIKSLDENAFIVMVSANHSPADVNEAKKNDIIGFVAKPYNKQKIYEFIHKFFDLNPHRKPKEALE